MLEVGVERVSGQGSNLAGVWRAVGGLAMRRLQALNESINMRGMQICRRVVYSAGVLRVYLDATGS